jgi:hypothetical protein
MMNDKWSPVVGRNHERHRIKPTNPKYVLMALLIFPFVTVGLPKFYTHMQYRREHYRKELEQQERESNEEKEE